MCYCKLINHSKLPLCVSAAADGGSVGRCGDLVPLVVMELCVCEPVPVP